MAKPILKNKQVKKLKHNLEGQAPFMSELVQNQFIIAMKQGMEKPIGIRTRSKKTAT